MGAPDCNGLRMTLTALTSRPRRTPSYPPSCLASRALSTARRWPGMTSPAQQRQLAVYQLLTLTFGHRPPGNRNPKRDFLEHIRRLEILDEEKELRRLPAAASGIDAVQLMTVHAAKGLEFRHVYIPSVSPSWFPPNARPDLCPLPPGIAANDALMTTDAEEESLMFVALSRAKDSLTVSRANRYGGSSRPNPSKLLKPLSPILAPGGEPAPQWTTTGPADPSPVPQKAPDGLSPELAVTALEDYLGCPRRYYYGEALGLSRRLADTPYLRFHSVIRAGLDWLRGRSARSAADVAVHLDTSWSERGPADHPAAAHYRGAAQRMLTNAGAAMSGHTLAAERRLTIEGVTITARADHIQMAGGGIVIQRMKAGRLAQEWRNAKGPLCAPTSHGEARRRCGRQLLACLAPRWQPERRHGCRRQTDRGGRRSGGGVERHCRESVRSETQQPQLPNLPFFLHLSRGRAAPLAGNPTDRFPVSL